MKKHHLLFDLFLFAIVPFCFGIGFFAVKEKIMTYAGPITGDAVDPLVLLRVGAFLLVVGIINFLSLAARQKVEVKFFLIVGVGCVVCGNFGPWTKSFPFVITGTLAIIVGAFNSLSLLMNGKREPVEKVVEVRKIVPE